MKVAVSSAVVVVVAMLPFLLQNHGANAAGKVTADATPSSGSAAAEQAFEQAMAQRQQSGALSLTQVAQLTRATSLQSAAADALRTKVFNAVRVRDLATTRTYFAGSEFKKERWALLRTIKAERGGGLIFSGGGVTNVKYSNVVVSGNTAQIQAAVTAYSDLEPIGQPAASPSNVLDVNATLVKSLLGQWQITVLNWDFEPGTGP